MFVEKQQRPENRSIQCMQELSIHEGAIHLEPWNPGNPLVFFTDLNPCTETQVLGSETSRLSSHFQQGKIVLFLSLTSREDKDVSTFKLTARHVTGLHMSMALVSYIDTLCKHTCVYVWRVLHVRIVRCAPTHVCMCMHVEACSQHELPSSITPHSNEAESLAELELTNSG